MGDIEFQTGVNEHEEIRSLSCSKGKSVYLVPFFNFFYYFILSPFRIQLNHENNHYQLSSSQPFRVLCALSHILVLLLFTYTLVMFIMKMSHKEPTIVVILNLISNSATVVASAIIMHLLWRRQEDFLQVIENTRLNISTAGRGKAKIGILVYSALFFVFITMSVFNYNFVIKEEHPYVSPLFLKDNDTKLNDDNWKWESHNKIWEWTVHILIIYTSTFYLSIEGILLVLSLSLCQMGKEFAMRMEQSRTGSIEIGIKHYRDLRRVCDLICYVYGDLLLAYYISAIAYYGEAPHVLLGKRGDMERVVLLYFVASGVVWIFAAEFHHHVRKTLQNWIRFNTDSKIVTLEDRLKLLAISNEIACDPIALSSKYFRVTYSHVGTMLGLILTYGIIVCQLYHNQ